MSTFVKLDDPDDLAWLSSVVSSLLVKYNANISAYVERAIQAERVLVCLQGAKVADSVTLHHSTAAAKAKPRAARGEATKPNLCATHPLYGAKRAPRTDCPECWSAYKKYAGKGQADVARRRFDRKETSHGA